MIKILFLLLMINYSESRKFDSVLRREVDRAVNLGIKLQNEGKAHKAAKIFKYVLNLDPKNVEALNYYNDFINLKEEEFQNNIHFYSISKESMTQKPLASLNLLTAIDILFEKFYKLTKSNNYLKHQQEYKTIFPKITNSVNNTPVTDHCLFSTLLSPPF